MYSRIKYSHLCSFSVFVFRFVSLHCHLFHVLVILCLFCCCCFESFCALTVSYFKCLPVHLLSYFLCFCLILEVLCLSFCIYFFHYFQSCCGRSGRFLSLNVVCLVLYLFIVISFDFCFSSFCGSFCLCSYCLF